MQRQEKIFQEYCTALVRDLREIHEAIGAAGHDSPETIDGVAAEIAHIVQTTPDSLPAFRQWSLESEDPDTRTKSRHARITAMLKAEAVRGTFSIDFLRAAGVTVSSKSAIVISTIQAMMQANPNIPLPFPFSNLSPLTCERWLREIPKRHVALCLDLFPMKLFILFLHAYGYKEMAVAKINDSLIGTSHPLLKGSELPVG